MRKQGVNACPGLRWIEGQCRFPVFLKDGGVVIHGHRTVGVAVDRSANPKDDIVRSVRQSCQSESGEKRPYEYSSQAISKIRR